MPTHWPRCKAEALVDSQRNKPEQNISRHLVTNSPRWQAEALVDTLPYRLENIEIQIIGNTLAKVPVEKKKNKEVVLVTLQHIGLSWKREALVNTLSDSQ